MSRQAHLTQKSHRPWLGDRKYLMLMEVAARGMARQIRIRPFRRRCPSAPSQNP